MEENKTNINWEKPIYINTYSNYWKHSLFIVEIFTFFNNEYKKRGKNEIYRKNKQIN